jgi:hypothetical protein
MTATKSSAISIPPKWMDPRDLGFAALSTVLDIPYRLAGFKKQASYCIAASFPAAQMLIDSV